jgi:hypothetical protein
MSFIEKLTAEELDEQYSSIANHIEAIEFNMLSDEGDSLSAVLQITAGWYRKLRLGRNAHAYVHDVGRKVWV